jgi:hypothetical protein
MPRHWKQGAHSQNVTPHRDGCHARKGNGDEAARLPFEQQQLDASITDATGAANVADMPAAAPATSNVFRSALVR